MAARTVIKSLVLAGVGVLCPLTVPWAAVAGRVDHTRKEHGALSEHPPQPPAEVAREPLPDSSTSWTELPDEANPTEQNHALGPPSLHTMRSDAAGATSGVPFDSNLLINPGAEMGNTTGWIGAPSFGVRTSDPAPLEGGYYFYAGSGAQHSLEQTVDLVAAGFTGQILDAGDLVARAGGYQRSWAQNPADEGRILVELQGSDRSVIDSWVGPIMNNSDRWELVATARSLPIGTRFVRFFFMSTRRNGTNNDGYLDAAFVMIGPTQVFPDSASREFSYGNVASKVLDFFDALSREFSFENVHSGLVEVEDAVSREFTFANTAYPKSGFVDAVSREFSFQNETTLQADIVDAFSREFSFENETQIIVTITDAVGREFSFSNEEAIRLTYSDAISREFTYSIPLPDLIVERIQPPEGEQKTRTPFSVAWTDKNVGGYPAEGRKGWWADHVFMSLSADDRSHDIACDPQPPSFFGSLAPDGELTRSAVCEWPIDPGCYYLIVKTDVLNDVDEGENEGNNVTVGPRHIAPSDPQPVCIPVGPDNRPNLKVVAGSINPPPRIITGQPATFTWQTTNVGDAAAVGPWSESIYLSRDGTIGNRCTLRDASFPQSLGVGDPPIERTKTFTVGSSACAGLNPGNYKAVVCADSTGPEPHRVVVESDETDNCEITGSAVCFNCLQPDLVVEEITPIPTVNDGQTVFVNFTVGNQGTGDAVGAWLDKVFLSKDTVIGNDDFREQLPHSGPLAAEAPPYHASIGVTIPPGLHGPYYFIACTDTENNVKEFGGEDNNCRIADQPTIIIQPNLPDLQVTLIGGDNDIPGAADPLYTGTTFNLFWQVKNTGTGTANDVWTDRVYLSSDDRLDVGVDEQKASAPFSGILYPQSFYTQSAALTLPASPGHYWYFVCTDTGAIVPEADESNNCSSFEVTVVAPEYGATAQVNVDNALVNTPVTVSGVVYDLANPSVLLPDKPIDIRVRVKNQRRVFSGKRSDKSGQYNFKLTMAPSDAGECKVFAEHPAVAENPDEPDDTFVFYGVQAPGVLNLPPRTGTGDISGSITLTNMGDTIVPGITAEAVETSDYFDVELRSVPGSISAGASASLGFVVHVLDIPPPNSPQTATIHTYIAGFSDAATTTVVNVYISPERARLVATPGSLAANAAIGSQVVVAFQVANVGGAPASDVRVLIPCLPNPGCNPGPGCVVDQGNCPTGLWMNLVTPALIGTIAPGESRNVELALQPRAGLRPGSYLPAGLTVAATDGGISVPFSSLQVISTEKGNLRVRVEDELTYYGFTCPECSTGDCPDCQEAGELNGNGPLLAGASVKVYDAGTGALKYSTTTGAAGFVTLTDVPEGFYKVAVRADKHGSYETTVEVKAADTSTTAAAVDEDVTVVTAFLPSNAVTYTWTVVPTEVEDEYSVTITATFETHVPLPVVTIEPTVIPLDLQPGESKQVDLTIRNHGYIAAQGAELVLADPMGYKITALFTDIGTIPPGDIPIVVPITITANSVAAATAGAGGSCTEAIPFGVRWFYICNVPVWKWTGCHFHKLRDCPAPNPGGGPCCGGGGGGGPGAPYAGSPSFVTADPNTCEQPKDPGDDGPPPCRNQCCKSDEGNGTDPVHLFSGEWVEQIEDLRIPGRGADFAWSRRYRSKAGPNTVQGNGWDFGYDMSIKQGGCKQGDGATPLDIAFRNGMGRCDVFKPQPGRTWTRSEYFEEFSQNPDGTLTFTQPDQGKQNFHALDSTPAAGKLLSVVDRNGNTMRFEYDAAGRLNKIIDTLGREITVAYNDDDLISSVTDFAGRQVKYEYYHDNDAGGSAGDLKSVTTPAVTATPNGNDFPTGKTATYTYSKGFADERLNHNLLTITDAKGQTYLRNVYHSTQDPTDRNFDRVVRQVWGDDGDNVDIVYYPLVASAQNGNAVMRTIVNDRVGNVTEYFFDAKNRLTRKREYTGRAKPGQPVTATSNRPTKKLRSTDPDYFETNYTWNSDSLLTRQTDPNGTVTEFVYESSLDPNAPVRSHANLKETHRLPGGYPAIGDQPEIVSLADFDTGLGGCCGFNFPTKETDARGNVTQHEYDERGNRKKTTYPIAGIVEDFEYNDFGQMTAHVLPDNGSGHKRHDEYVYYDSGAQKGYLQKQIVDAGPDGLNLTTTYEYDAVGNIVKVTDPRGHDTQYDVNALNQVVRETSREVQILDNQGNPSGSVRYQRDTTYDADNNVVRIDVQNIDDAGQIVAANPYLTTTYEYEILNNLVRKSEEVDEGRNIVTEYAYDADRNRTLVRFGEATAGRRPDNVVQTLYDERNLGYREVRGAGGPDQSATQYDYDGNRNQIAVRQGVDGNGNTDHVTISVYDAFNRLVRSVDAMGNVTLYQYDANGNRALATVEGELDDVPGDADNLLLSQTHYTYDALNRLTRTDVAFFNTNTQQAIEDGQTTTITEYSPNSQVVKTTDDRGNATLTSYDSVNRRKTVTDPKGNTVTYEYDGSSNVVKITEVEKSDLEPPDSPGETFVTVNEYDALDRLIMTKDNLLNTNRSYYDSRNNPTKTVDALSHEVRYVYDGLNRLLKTVRDMDGNGADANATTDGMANLDIVTTQTWDDSSRLTSQTDDNGNTTRYVYDGLNRKTVEIYADATEKRWRFDVHDDNVFWTDANQNQVTQFFDALDRRTDVDVIPGPGVSNDTTFEVYKYDGVGRLIWAQDDDSIVTRGYDSLSRVTVETQQYLDETPAVVKSVYDGAGNNTLLYYPSGRVVETTYDSLNRKKLIKDQGDSTFIAKYVYIGPSRVERRDYGNNTRLDVEYDGARRTTRTRHTFIGHTCNVDEDCPSGDTCEAATQTCIIDDRTYAWDPMYNKTQLADVRPGGPLETRDYTYDSVYRLVKSDWHNPSGPVETFVYELDGVGNRIHVGGGSDAGDYIMDARSGDFAMNQYSATPFDGRTFDANGNLVEIRKDDDYGRFGGFDLADFARFQACFDPSGNPGFPCLYFDADGDGAIGLGDWGILSQSATGPTSPSRTVSYDFANREVLTLDATTAGRFAYAYDALSRRLAKTIELAETVSPERFVSYLDQEIAESASSGEQTTHVFGNYIDEVLQSRGEVMVYSHADQLFSVSAITELDGSVAAALSYGDYGNLFSSIVTNTSHTFTGRRLDIETSNHYSRTRYYSATLGRFLSRDHIGAWGDPANLGNATTYVGNSPQQHLDPFGLSPADDDRSVIGVLACWALGICPDSMDFGPRSPRTADMAATPGVAEARRQFQQQNAGVICCSDLKPLTPPYKSIYGVTGSCPDFVKKWGEEHNKSYWGEIVDRFCTPGYLRTPPWTTPGIVGTFKVRIEPRCDSKIELRIVNRMGLQSLSGGLVKMDFPRDQDAWWPEPMDDLWMRFHWQEPYRCVPSCRK